VPIDAINAGVGFVVDDVTPDAPDRVSIACVFVDGGCRDAVDFVQACHQAVAETGVADVESRLIRDVPWLAICQ
jgi:hypothetical protein